MDRKDDALPSLINSGIVNGGHWVDRRGTLRRRRMDFQIEKSCHFFRVQGFTVDDVVGINQLMLAAGCLVGFDDRSTVVTAAAAAFGSYIAPGKGRGNGYN